MDARKSLALCADKDAKSLCRTRTKLETRLLLVLIELGIADEINGLCIKLCVFV